jgi:hypothetical protein
MLTKRLGLAIPVVASLLAPGLVLAQNLLPSDNAFVQLSSNNLGQNNGHLQVQYSVNGQNVNQSTVSLIRFDLSPLLKSTPAVSSTDVQSANLILFVDSGGAAGNVTVCELVATPVWSSASVTGNTTPGCSTQTAVFTVTSSQVQKGAFISIPITMIVQSWLSSGTVNNGIELVADAPTGGANPENIQFASLANNGQGFAPMIEVVLNTGVTTISTGSGLLVNGGAGPAAGTDTLAIDPGVVATNSSVSSAVAAGVTTAENAANAALANFAINLSSAFLSLAGGTVTGAVEAKALNSDTTLQILSQDVLKADTSNNSAIGLGAMTSTTGSDNTATGSSSLKANKTGSRNTGHGSGSLSSNTSGNDNTAHGWNTLKNVSEGNYNTAVGSGAMSSESLGNNNVAHGKEALKLHTSGDDNTAIGTQAGMNLQTGTKNILFGKLAGQNLKSTESSNILINHDGETGDNNTIRFGNDIDQKKAYIAGIYETDHSQNTKAKHVLIDTTTGQLGIDPNAAQTSVSSVSPGTGLTTAANSTADSPVLAVDTKVIAQQTDVATAQAAAQTAAQGYAATAQAAAQAASLSLASGGTVAAPVTVQAAVEAQTLNSDNTFQIQKQDVLKADANLNTASGFNVLKAIKTGIQNTGHGEEALKSEISGNNNVAHGLQALMSHTSGDDNTAIGTQAGMNLQTGIKNLLFGKLAGQNLKSNESSNILINHDGVTGDNNTIRIGNDTDQKKAYIAGVWSRTANTDAIPVVIDSTGNLGTVASSRRYKEDIHDMGAASDALLRLRPVTFRYKKPDGDGSKPVQYGLIAEEVAEVYPDLVVHGKDGQVETVQYYKLDAMLLNEVQKLSRANAADQAEITTLRSQLTEQLKQAQEQQAAIKQLLKQVQSIQATVAAGRPARARVASTAAKKKAKPAANQPASQLIASAGRSVTGE